MKTRTFEVEGQEIEITEVKYIFECEDEIQRGFYIHQKSDVNGDGDGIVHADNDSLEDISNIESLLEEMSTNFEYDTEKDLYYVS